MTQQNDVQQNMHIGSQKFEWLYITFFKSLEKSLEAPNAMPRGRRLKAKIWQNDRQAPFALPVDVATSG